jgi:predicted metal-dependent peptidase
MSSYLKNYVPKMHKKLTDAVVAMMATGDLPYYGEFALFINFHEINSPQVPTAGVNVSTEGMNFFWNPEFIDSLPQPEVNFLLLHEEFHLLFDHIKRTVGYDAKMANIAQDMIINQIIYDEIMKLQGLGKPGTGVKGDPFLDIPKDHFKNNSALFIPKEYKGEDIFEELYEWLISEQKKWKQKNSDKVKDMKDNTNSCPKCGSSMNEDEKSDKDSKGEDGGEGKEGDEKDSEGKGDGDDGKGEGEGKGEGKGDGSDGEPSGSEGDGSGSGSGGEQEHDPNTCPSCGHKKSAKEQMESRNGDKDTEGNDRYGKNGKNDVECYSKETIFEGEERNEQNTLDTHITDEVPPEMKREVVEGVMQTLKSRGLSSGEVETILNKLRKTRKDYLKEIKRTMSSHVFGTKKQKTIVRPNRRGIVGLKGHKKYRTEINVILDTSGSMGGEFEKVLSYVFQNDIEINLIQIDARVQDVIKIKDKKQLEKMRIRGLGGTTLQPGIDFMSNPKNKIHRNNTVILTDGWTDNLNFKEVKTQTLILSTASKCPIDWDNGKVKQILDVGKQE